MRNLKKFLALVMAMVMAMSLMVTADAKVVKSTSFTDEGQITPAFDEAVAVLAGMGIINGYENGSFDPAGTITRAEAAAIIYRVVTADVKDNQAELYRNVNHGFADVTPDKWYAGYVGYLWNAKIIKGVDQSHFNPSAKVTGYEILAMILRANGYDENGEFTGATWQVTVASTAHQEGVLKDIQNTHFADTLYAPARRDVVASMIFRTIAYAPQVQWTSAFSYQKYGMTGGVVSSTLNKTLGEQNFGLACRTGVIVGNQSTGEDWTKLGVGVDGTTGALVGVNYNYLSSTSTTGIDATTGAGNVTLAYKITTGLDLFGHKVNMWYDNRTSGTNESYAYGTTNPAITGTERTNYGRAYVAYDLAQKDIVVFADDNTTNDKAATGVSILDAAKSAGFDGNNAVWVSDRYSRMAKDTTNDANSADGGKSKVGLYRLIANSGNNKYDVVIKLNQEVGTITQINNSDYNGNYVVLGNGGSYFGGKVISGDSHNDGKLLEKNLKGDLNFKYILDNNRLGLLVTANEVVGTVWKDNSGTIEKPTDSADYFYVLEELKAAFTGSVASYTTLADASGSSGVSNLLGTVNLNSTERYSVSGITGSANWNFGDAVQYSHLLNGIRALTSDNVQMGVTYDFYTDAAGRIIGVNTPNDYSFLYATFADYEIGALGTGTSGYYVYGVDWNGNVNKTGIKLNSITQPYDHNVSTGSYAFADLDQSATYPGKTAATNSITQERMSLEDGRLALAYTLLPVTMKNQGNANAGNQIREGDNTAYKIDSQGNMDWNSGARRFIGWFDDNVAGGAAKYNWTITRTDADNGFARVWNSEPTNQGLYLKAPANASDNKGYVLTNSTKFVVVTGSGTADLNAVVYTGMSELLGTGNGAEITFNGGDNVYFKTTADRYGNANTLSNDTIDTVILSDTNLNRFSSNNLFFAAPGTGAISTSNLVGAPAGRSIKMYELYNGDQLGTYWIDESVSMDSTGAYNTGANGRDTYGDFYTLAKIDTINGQPIYRATVVRTNGNYSTNVGGCYTADGTNVDSVEYEYIAVNELNTAQITTKKSSTQTGDTKVWKVTGAKVVEAFGKNTANTLTNPITSLSTLNWAVAKRDVTGREYQQYNVKVAFVYEGVNVSCIYVIGIEAGTAPTP